MDHFKKLDKPLVGGIVGNDVVVGIAIPINDIEINIEIDWTVLLSQLHK